jgi:hypothetical protein
MIKSFFTPKFYWARLFGHGLKNPIFPKNRIYWAPDLFLISWARLFGHGFKNPIFSKNRIYWAPKYLKSNTPA